MKTILTAALAATCFAAPAMADHTSGHVYNQYLDQPNGNVVVVSCFRGPWVQTIWDHPTARFIDSLVSVGYDIATAESIANRICRDVTLVGDDEGLKHEMERIIAESPRYGR